MRICNRNGEFLYVEDNNLHVGIPNGTASTEISEAYGYEIEFNEDYLNNMPAGCHNSYGAGEAIGCKNTAKEILHLIETGEYPDD